MDLTRANTRSDMAEFGKNANTMRAARAHAGMVEVCILKKLRIPEVKEAMRGGGRGGEVLGQLALQLAD